MGVGWEDKQAWIIDCMLMAEVNKNVKSSVKSEKEEKCDVFLSGLHTYSSSKGVNGNSSQKTRVPLPQMYLMQSLVGFLCMYLTCPVPVTQCVNG